MDNIGKILSFNLKNLREERGWNQNDLAERAKLSVQTIQLAETGKRWPRKPQITKIARAFGVSEASLFNDPDAMNLFLALEKIAKKLRSSTANEIPPDILDGLSNATDNDLKSIRAVIAGISQKSKKKAL